MAVEVRGFEPLDLQMPSTEFHDRTKMFYDRHLHILRKSANIPGCYQHCYQHGQSDPQTP